MLWCAVTKPAVATQRVGLYTHIFTAAYSTALQLNTSDVQVSSISCAGTTVYNNTGTSSGADSSSNSSEAAERLPSRLLLAATAVTPTQQPQQQVDVPVATAFAISSQGGPGKRLSFVDAVEYRSGSILAGPLSKFFGMAVYSVSGEQLLPEQPAGGGTAGDMHVIPAPAALDSNMAGGTAGSTGSTDTRSAASTGSTTGTESNVSQQQQQQQQLHGEGDETIYDTFPACPFPPSSSNSNADTQGRLWGSYNARVCLFKAASTPAAQGVAINWNTAKLCVLPATNANSVVDKNGRLWGWEDGQSCAFRSPVQQPVQSITMPKSGLSIVSFQSLQSSKLDRMSVVWEGAPSCTAVPTASNTVADKFGRLWGWEDGVTCAFKVGGCEMG